MIDSVHRQVVKIVVANPGPSVGVAICSFVLAAQAAKKFYQLGMTYLENGEKAGPEQKQDETKCLYGRGAFLDGLTALPPTMEFSACESLFGYGGFAPPGIEEAERNFAELLRACRKLPATVDGAPWLQKQIDSLHAKVDLLSRTHYGAAERDDGLNAIDALWDEAVRLGKRLKIRHQRQTYQPDRSIEVIKTSEAMARLSPEGHPGGPGLSHGERQYEPPDPQTVKRRKVNNETKVANASRVQPSHAESFALSETERLGIRAAIERAWNDSDGAQRVTHKEQCLLGMALTGIVGGAYHTHPSHEGPRDRRYTVRHIFLQATEYMPPWQRDAVRTVCETTLQELARPART